VPRQLEIPSNLYFIGTVNVDETTYMFSPKVLDRAFCIELNDVDLEGLAGRTPPASTLQLDKWDGRLRGADKPGREDWRVLGSDPEGEKLRGTVVELHGLLSKEHRHFGYRVANEIARYVNLARVQCSKAEAAAVALDLALLQKVLPKLHGTQQEIQGVVDALLGFALEGGGESSPDSWTYEPSTRSWTMGNEEASPRLPRTAAKLWRMRERLRAQGFTAFIE
jgi:5-methylcytosine-specific restriction protein B